MPEFTLFAHEQTMRSISGRYASISEIAAAEKIDRGYADSILRLTLLAPDIVQSILDGRQPDGLGLPALLKPFPLEWYKQRTTLLGALDTARSSSHAFLHSPSAKVDEPQNLHF
jgi:hypothetical protein